MSVPRKLTCAFTQFPEDDDKDFLIGEELEFRTGRAEGEHTLVWRDVDGDVDETYEFVAIGTNKHMIDLFASCMYKAMFERKYKVSGETASDEELQQFAWLCVIRVSVLLMMKSHTFACRSLAPSGTIQQPLSSSSSVSATREDPSSATPRKSAVVSPKPTTTSPSARTTKPAPQTTYPSVISKSAELHFWNNEESRFEKEADATAQIVKPHADRYQYWLSAFSEEGQTLAHQLSSDLNARWSKKVSGLTWNYMSQQGTQRSWCLIFQNEEDFSEFQEAYSTCLYESLNEISWAKAKVSHYHMYSYLCNV